MKVRNSKLAIRTFAAVLAGCISAFAADSATQTVSFEVQAINEISLMGAPSLIISTATAGSAPTAATASAAYAITTNQEGRKITGSIEAPMPFGTALSIQLDAPTGATSLGKQVLGTSAVDLVTGISLLNEAGRGISYELTATSAAGVIPAGTREVTLTITAGEI